MFCINKKNDMFQMRPSFLNKTKTKKRSETVKNQFGLPGKGCPIGTVPIRKTTKDDLINVKAVTDATELRVSYSKLKLLVS